MKIIIFAEHFEHGAWTEWEHTCTDAETAAVENAAEARALERASTNGVFFIDYLMGAEGIFNVIRGGIRTPLPGDTKVFGIAVGEMIFARYERLKHHFELSVVA